MEAEATVRAASNGVEKDAPVPIIEHERPSSIELKTLLDKREKMVQGLNSLKADRDAMAQQLADQETSIKRTEGALIMLNSIIQELDPTALQGQGR